MKPYSYILGLTFLLVPAMSVQAQDEHTPEERLDFARKVRDKGYFDLAAEYLEELAKTSPKSASPKAGAPSKADFVRQNPGLSAKDLVTKAKAEGVSLATTYVYNVRGQDQKAAQKKKAAKKLAASTPVAVKTSTPKTAPKVTSVTPKTSSASSVEALLLAAAAELGLGRALEILQGERARVRAVLGG